MNSLFRLMIPEMILATVACFLFLLGVSRKPSSRSLAALIALLTLIVVFIWQLANPVSSAGMADDTNTIHLFSFGQYIKLLASGVGILLVLLAWPSNRDATGNAALNFGEESGEFFALMLLSITGVFLVAGANDIILLFLGIELASIPTYIMVSISRPLPVAQEAGVKYFFLGAMAAAIMLFGFSYLYGTTGLTKISEISALFHRSVGSVYPNNLPPILTTWQLLAVLMLLAGFAFKIAAVPLHFYAGDVYQGAATPVTAFLAFIPKTSGFVAIIKLLFMAGGGSFMLPETIIKTLWVIAALTMTVGNVLGLLQFNVKRVLAYSSIAHSGYMLVGLTALISATSAAVQTEALQGVLFYLAAYGIMNAGAFGVLTLLPARRAAVATSAETFEDLAGEGRKHPALGLAMAVCCFSLTGLPLTIGFFGKLFLIKPALDVGTRSMNWLVVITMVNAAISAAYYLRIVGAMFLRDEPKQLPGEAPAGEIRANFSMPVLAAVILSVAGTLLFGIILPATSRLTTRTTDAAATVDHISPIQPAAETTALAR